jgi:hypothetical protein
MIAMSLKQAQGPLNEVMRAMFSYSSSASNRSSGAL